MTRGKAGSVVAVAAMAVALAAGGAAVAAGQPAHSAAVTTLRLSADPHGQLKFSVRTLSARAGKITLVMKNPKSAGLAHGIGVKGHGHGKVVDAGKTSTVTVTLKKGKYVFYCPAPGHAAAGMKGTLTIK
jgi:plastocyanin